MYEQGSSMLTKPAVSYLPCPVKDDLFLTDMAIQQGQPLPRVGVALGHDLWLLLLRT